MKKTWHTPPFNLYCVNIPPHSIALLFLVLPLLSTRCSVVIGKLTKASSFREFMIVSALRYFWLEIDKNNPKFVFIEKLLQGFIYREHSVVLPQSLRSMKISDIFSEQWVHSCTTEIIFMSLRRWIARCQNKIRLNADATFSQGL